MLQLRETRLIRSLPELLLPGVDAPLEEGGALVYVKGADGETYVRTSTGNAGEIFAGVGFGRQMPPQLVPISDSVVVDASLVVTLPRTPFGDQLSFVDPITNTLVDPSAYSVQGALVTFDAALKDKQLSYVLRFVPTVDEARALLGDMPFGGNAFGNLGAINSLKQGTVGTSMFDASGDWTKAMGVKLAAGGLLAAAKNAAEAIPGVVVKNSPNVGNPYLVLALNIA